MIGFILVVLIIGALLSAIFGRRVGAMFVTGTGAIVILGFGILLLLLSPLIYGFFTAPSSPSSQSTYSSSYGSTYTPPQSSSQAVPDVATQPASSAGPQIGITLKTLNAQGYVYYGLPQGYGIGVASVVPQSPAEVAGLQTNDVIVSVDGHWITGPNTLSDYETRKGTGNPVHLHVYRIIGSTKYNEYFDLTPHY